MRIPLDITVRNRFGPVRPGEEVFIYATGTDDEIPVYQALTGSAAFEQPLTTNSEGQVDGYVEERADAYVPTDTANPRRPQPATFVTAAATDDELDALEAEIDAVGAAVTALSPTVSSYTRYVSTSGNDANSGLSWRQAKLTIEAAVADVATFGGQVLVAPGTYTPADTIDVTGVRIIGMGTRGSTSYVHINHSFDGDLFYTEDGCGLEKLVLWNTGDFEGAAVHAFAPTTTNIGYIWCREIDITGSTGWERDLILDGSNATNGIRSVFFDSCLFFGAASGETLVIDRGVHVFFNGCDFIQAPVLTNPSIRILDVYSEEIHFSGCGFVGVDIYVEAGGFGCQFDGHFNGDIECASGSENNLFVGPHEPGFFTNNGEASNRRLSQREVRAFDNGRPGVIAPSGRGWVTVAAGIGANVARGTRFVPPRDMVITKIAFNLMTPAGSNDDVCVAIYNSDLSTRLATSGAVAGKLNASAGVQTVDLTAPLELEGGLVYYAFISKGTQGSTAEALAAANFIDTESGMLFGSAIGNSETATATASHPLPTSIGSPNTSGTGIVLAVRES